MNQHREEALIQGLGPLHRRIEAKMGTAFVLKKGSLLRVIDPFGEQVSELFCFDLNYPDDFLSSSKTLDYNESVHIAQGNRLYSLHGKPMLEILEDTCHVHDFLIGPCTLQGFKQTMPGCAYHSNCLENLALAFENFPVDSRRISTTLCIFKNVSIEKDGALRVLPPKSLPGDQILFKAKRDLFVGLTACADEFANNGTCKPIDFEIY